MPPAQCAIADFISFCSVTIQVNTYLVSMQVPNNLVQLSVGESPCIRGNSLRFFFVFFFICSVVSFFFDYHLDLVEYWDRLHDSSGFFFQFGLGDLYCGIAACIE